MDKQLYSQHERNFCKEIPFLESLDGVFCPPNLYGKPDTATLLSAVA